MEILKPNGWVDFGGVDRFEKEVFGEARQMLSDRYIKKSELGKWLRRYGGVKFIELVDEAVRRWVHEAMFKRPEAVLRLLQRGDEGIRGWRMVPELVCERCRVKNIAK